MKQILLPYVMITFLYQVEAEVSDVVMAIVQNKMDLIDESVVTQ